MGRDDDEWLNPRQIKREFGVSEQTQAHWRCKGIGPDYSNINGRIWSKRGWWRSFYEARRRNSTSAEAA